MTIPRKTLKDYREFRQVNLNNCMLLYGCVSQGLGTTEFTNLIG